MRIRNTQCLQSGKVSGFTLAEVVISVAILGVLVQGVILGYTSSTERTEWNARALAAQSLASQGAEQARSAKWEPQAWPRGIGPGRSDELGLTNYTQIDILDIPAQGNAIVVTNYISITEVSANPPIRQIRSDCVWKFLNRGYFTNSVVLLRASDQ